MKECDYCGQEGKHVACDGNVCCEECWEGGMKNWTPEKQAELEQLNKETAEWMCKVIPEIKIENGLTFDAPGIVCVQCRKMVQIENGLLFCECYDERN